MSSRYVIEEYRFPFSAVFGMDDAKRAIMCSIVNKNVRTVLIRGPSGVAKTTIARSVSRISNRNVVNIPLNATEEQIFGGMDVASTLAEGRIKTSAGLLQLSDSNILYIDDVNLMDQNILISILEAVRIGKVTVERDGVSDSYKTETILIASMNPEEVDLSPHVLDRFDACAYVSVSEEEGGRDEIIRRHMDFIKDPVGFSNKFSEEEDAIKDKLERATMVLPYVTISDELVDIIVELCTRIGAEGHRGDVAMLNVSKAIAAINSRDEVIKKDIEEAAVLCLTHRRNQSPQAHPPEQEQRDDNRQNNEQENKEKEKGEDDYKNEQREKDEVPPPSDLPDIDSMFEDMLFDIEEQFKIIDYLDNTASNKIRRTKSRMGRRGIVESGDKTGRYSRYRIPIDRNPDVAFDATIRAAAPHQSSREHSDLAICIKSSDIREKVKKRRSGCTILFLVDASGSLGVRKRMATVKGAIMSMLKESYVKRDRVGMMAFRRYDAELILPPTRSVEYSYRKLEEMPTGGRTPLGEALLKVSAFMSTYSRSHPGEVCYIVVVTDGRANISVKEGSDANEEVSEIAGNIRLPGVRWIVIDAGIRFARFDHAEELAKRLGGTYFRLDDLNADRLIDGVKRVINKDV